MLSISARKLDRVITLRRLPVAADAWLVRIDMSLQRIEGEENPDHSDQDVFPDKVCAEGPWCRTSTIAATIAVCLVFALVLAFTVTASRDDTLNSNANSTSNT